MQLAQVGERVEVQFDHVRPPAKQRQGTRAGDSLLWNSDGCHTAPPALAPESFQAALYQIRFITSKTMSSGAFRVSILVSMCRRLCTRLWQSDQIIRSCI